MIAIRQIRAVADQIAQRFAPQRIILFGSYAYGSPSKDSDVDLMILMKGARVHDRAIGIRNAIDFNFPVDLLVRSPEEFDRRIAWGDSFLTEIQQKGKVLYEAADTRVGQKSRLSVTKTQAKEMVVRCREIRQAVRISLGLKG